MALNPRVENLHSGPNILRKKYTKVFFLPQLLYSSLPCPPQVSLEERMRKGHLLKAWMHNGIFINVLIYMFNFFPVFDKYVPKKEHSISTNYSYVISNWARRVRKAWGMGLILLKRTVHFSILCNTNSWKENEAKILALKIRLGLKYILYLNFNRHCLTGFLLFYCQEMYLVDE